MFAEGRCLHLNKNFYYFFLRGVKGNKTAWTDVKDFKNR